MLNFQQNFHNQFRLVSSTQFQIYLYADQGLERQNFKSLHSIQPGDNLLGDAWRNRGSFVRAGKQFIVYNLQREPFCYAYRDHIEF